MSVSFGRTSRTNWTPYGARSPHATTRATNCGPTTTSLLSPRPATPRWQPWTRSSPPATRRYASNPCFPDRSAGAASSDPGLAGLGELRAAFERVQVGPELVLLRLRLRLRCLVLFEGLLRLGRQAQLEDVARRHRVLAAHHHDVPEHLLEQRGRLAAGGGRPGEQAAHEPARAVDADEPDQPHARGRLPGLRGNVCHQLDAERSHRLLAPPAGAVHLGRDLGPDVIPQRALPRRGERLDLHLALAVLHRDPGAVLFGHDELDLVLGADRHAQAAQIDALPLGV